MHHQRREIDFLLIYKKSNKETRIDPCGNLHERLEYIEKLTRTFTCSFLLNWYDLNQSFTSFDNPGDSIF